MPRSLARSSIRFTAALLIVATAMAGARASAADADRVPAIDAWLTSWAEAGFLSGCVSVSRGDEIVYERCFGEANAEHGIPNGPQTRFAIASITKAMQQVLLARLVDAGRLSLDDTLSRWLPDFPRADEITVLQLATHRAAVPHRVTDHSTEIFPRTAADMVDLVVEKGLLGDPGGESVYSSGGYSVLARVLELAGEAGWEELMEREVFRIADMTHTVHPADRRLIPGRAASYKWTPDGRRLTDPKDLSFLVGAGSLYSTPEDLQKFMRAVVEGAFGATAQEYLLEDGDLSSNGLTNGYRAFIDYTAATELGIAVCANVVSGALAAIREALPTAFGDGALPAVELPDMDAIAAAAAGSDFTVYEGEYELRPGRNLGIRSAGTYLDVDGWMLLPLGPDTFFCVQDFGRVEFRHGADGAVNGLVWGDSGYEMSRVGDLE